MASVFRDLEVGEQFFWEEQNIIAVKTNIVYRHKNGYFTCHYEAKDDKEPNAVCLSGGGLFNGCHYSVPLDAPVTKI